MGRERHRDGAAGRLADADRLHPPRRLGEYKAAITLLDRAAAVLSRGVMGPTAVFVPPLLQDYSIPCIDLFTEPEGRGRITAYHDDTIETGTFGIPLSTASIQVYSGV